jgi:hypothetical protein
MRQPSAWEDQVRVCGIPSRYPGVPAWSWGVPGGEPVLRWRGIRREGDAHYVAGPQAAMRGPGGAARRGAGGGAGGCWRSAASPVSARRRCWATRPRPRRISGWPGLRARSRRWSCRSRRCTSSAAQCWDRLEALLGPQRDARDKSLASIPGVLPFPGGVLLGDSALRWPGSAEGAPGDVVGPQPAARPWTSCSRTCGQGAAGCWWCAASRASARPRCWTTQSSRHRGSGSRGPPVLSRRWSSRSRPFTNCACQCWIGWSGCRARSTMRSAWRSG